MDQPGGLEHAFEQEDSDVRKLEGLSITSLFANIFGSKEERLKMERQERLAAQLKVDEYSFAIASIEREITGLQEQIARLGCLDSEYKSILDCKASLIDAVGDEAAERLLGLTEAVANKHWIVQSGV